MSNSAQPATVVGARYWVYLLARAVPAAIVAIAITFSADHSVRVGWIALAVFGVLTGGVVAVGGLRALTGAARTTTVQQGGVLALAGAVAVYGAVGLGLPVFVGALAVVFVVSGALELIAGLRSRGSTPVSRDWIFLGATSVVFGLVVLLIPTDLSQAITIPGKEVPNLTAAVVLVGSLGAYAAIAAVYLVIAGLSLKWAKHPEAVVRSEGAS